MTVICKVEKCPYRSGSGFCKRKILLITSNGSCGNIFKENGIIRQNWMSAIDENLIQGSNKEEHE